MAAPTAPTAFRGTIAQLKILKNRYDHETMIVNAFKIEHKYSNENEDLLTYFDFDPFENLGTATTILFNDNSINFKTFVGVISGSSSPTITQFPDLPNSMCLRHDARFCRSFYSSSIPTVIPDSKYLGLSTSTFDYFRIYSSKTSNILNNVP